MKTNPRVLLFALCAAGFTGWTLFLGSTLPPRLAVHFDGAGVANGWMTPTGHLATVLGVVGYVEQRLEDSIYEATPGILAELVDASRETERLLLVGHNPGL